MPEFAIETLSRVVQIILIDLVLSGDNAVVIGMAVHPLPPRQRRFAILVGGGGAIALRVLLTGGAALLLGVPGLRLVGGVLLLWIAFTLLREEEESSAGARQATTMRGAIATVLLADLIMSLDNILGVAAASGGDVVLLLVGLFFSVAIVVVGGGLFAELIDRLWWLAYLGAALIAWTGADMALNDDVIDLVVPVPDTARLIASLAATVVVVALGHRVHRWGRP